MATVDQLARFKMGLLPYDESTHEKQNVVSSRGDSTVHGGLTLTGTRRGPVDSD